MRINNNNSKFIISQQELKNTDKKIESLTPSVKKIFNYYAATANIRKSTFVSQTLVAKELGLSRATVNRALKLLHELGLITKIDRGWKEDRARIKKTCYYMINKIFFYQEIRDRYKHIFIALSYMVIFCNFESIFGVYPKVENKPHNESVTGIKSSPNSLFINNVFISPNMHIKNDTLYVREKRNDARSSNMWENNKSDKVDLYKKYERPKTQQPFKKEQKEQKKITPPKEWQSQIIPKEEMKSPEEIVGKIVKLLETPNDFTKFAIKKLLDIPYLLENTENEHVYIEYLDWKRREYGITAITVQAEPIIEKKENIKKPIDYDKVREALKPSIPLDVKPIEIKRESSTLNEIEFEEVLDGTI